MSVPAVVYAVRSKADERSRTEGQEGSTESQVEKVRARLADDAERTIVGIFKEDGFSGSKRNRGPQLEAAIQTAVRAAEQHGRAELWAFTSSRFGRGTSLKGEARAVGALFYELRDKGVALRTVADDEFVTNEMLIGFASRQASKYTEDLAANVRRGKDAQLKRGVWLGGPVPEGWLLEPMPGTRPPRARLVRDRDRAPVILRLIALAQEGWGRNTLARKMNGEGYRTVRGRAWQGRSVENVLLNPVHAGAIVRHRGKPNEEINWDGEHRDQAYLSREDYKALRAAFASRDKAKRGRPQSGQPTRRYALAKLAECAVCGGRMYSTTSPYRRKDGTHARRYVCGNVKGSTGLCDAAPVDAEQVDGWIVEDLHRLTFDFDTWFASVTAADHDERAAAERELADVEDQQSAQRRRVRQVEATLLRWIEGGQEDRADALADTLTRQQQELSRLERAATNLRARLTAEPDHGDEVDAALDWWNTVRR
ncbi:MAG: recombinase family protein [Actinomycetota bacterium]|nr:recombinase family protein [Actinomycetota bacterium]